MDNDALDDVLEPCVLRAELLSVGVDVPEASIVGWGIQQRMEAYSWVAAVHEAWHALDATEDELLQASPDAILPVSVEVEYPDRPRWVRDASRPN